MVSMRFPLVYEVGEDNPKKINVKVKHKIEDFLKQ